MTARLIAVTFNEARFAGLRPLTRIDVTNIDRDGQLVGWRVFVRGAAIVLVSPPGWPHKLWGHAPQGSHWKPDDCCIYEAPRSQCSLEWASDEPDAALESLTKFSPAPLPTSTLPDPLTRATVVGLGSSGVTEEQALIPRRRGRPPKSFRSNEAEDE